MPKRYCFTNSDLDYLFDWFIYTYLQINKLGTAMCYCLDN